MILCPPPTHPFQEGRTYHEGSAVQLAPGPVGVGEPHRLAVQDGALALVLVLAALVARDVRGG